MATRSTTVKLNHSGELPPLTIRDKLPAGSARRFHLDGILALLVTDLAGFTMLVETLGDIEAQTMMREHNDMLRECIREHDGTEVAHTGDGIIAAFRSVMAAIGCAHQVHSRLARHAQQAGTALRARVGIHAGEPLAEEERLFGQCVNTAVRVCGMAEPGRILVTDVIEQLARGRFVFSRGVLCRLKGLSQPMMLYGA